jgi:hypothetical protein
VRLIAKIAVTASALPLFAACVDEGLEEKDDDALVSRASALASVTVLPARIQAEDYTAGGEGIGYHDVSSGNSGHQYRTDDVDIEAATDSGGGFNVGWTAAGEWTAYSLAIPTPGTYEFVVRAASGYAGTKSFHLELDGNRLGAPVTISTADGWQAFRNHSIGKVSLPSGNHTLKLVHDTGRVNVNFIDALSVCTVSAKLVPSCGAWWGISEAPRDGETVAQAMARMEGQVGRKFDIAHSYKSGNAAFPNPTEVQWSNEGRYLLTNWKPSGSWAEAASGQIDDLVIVPVADRIKAFGKPMFLALFHEPENDIPPKGNAGQPADYVAMWKHVRAVFDARGVTNVVWVWNMMGFAGWADYYVSGALYPGDSYVDWIAYDPYQYGDGTKWKSFESTVNQTSASFAGFYTWATTAHPGKPLMLGEYGTGPNSTDVNARKQWFLDELAALKTTRRAIKAVVYFDQLGNSGDWRLHLGSDAPRGLEGFTLAGHDPFVNVAHSR